MTNPIRWMMLIALTAALPAGCDERPAAVAPDRPVIAVTIFPVADLVGQLAGDWADVVTLAPVNTGGAFSSLSAETLPKLKSADLLVAVGTSVDDALEAKARAAAPAGLRVIRFADLAKNPSPTTATSAPATQPSLGENPEPWLDLVLADRFVEALGPQLESMFPDRRASLRTRVQLLRANLLELHQEYAGKFAHAPRRQLATFGNRFDAAVRRYGMEVVAHLEGNDPAAVEMVKNKHLPVVYAMPGLHRAERESVRQATGVEVLILDPIGDPNSQGYSTHLTLMRSNFETLAMGQSMAALP